MKTRFFAVAAVLISGLLVGCSGDVRIENPNANNGEAPSQTPSENPEASVDSGSDVQSQSGRISETLSGESSEITLNSVSFAESSQYFESEYGQFIVLNLTIENTSQDSLSLSSLGSFELQGSDLYIYSQAFGVDTRGSLDSTLAPGASVRGEIAFDVPELDSFEIRYTENFFSQARLVFVFDFSEISR
jgi:hypothetical protein